MFDPIARPLAALLAAIYSVLPNYGVAIVILTVAVMVVLTPLTIKQTRSMLVMQRLQPELKRLQEKHKNDRAALNEAVMALYKAHGASPFGGCLPMLLPLPVFFALFRVLEGLTRKVNGKVSPKYLATHQRLYTDIVHDGGKLKAFGMDLAKSAQSAHAGVAAAIPYFVLLLAMVGTQYYQQRQLTSRNPQTANNQQAQMMKFIPIVFGVLSIRFPAGVVVYWFVSNLIRIFQQWAMYRYDPKLKSEVAADVREVEARTREIDKQQGSGTSRPRLRDLLAGGGAGAAGGSGSGGGSGSVGGSGPGGGRNDPKSGGGGSGGKPDARPDPGSRGSGSTGANGSSNGKPSGGGQANGRTGAGPNRSSGNRSRSKRARRGR